MAKSGGTRGGGGKVTIRTGGGGGKITVLTGGTKGGGGKTSTK